MICTFCGSALNDDVQICPQCGSRLAAPTHTTPVYAHHIQQFGDVPLAAPYHKQPSVTIASPNYVQQQAAVPSITMSSVSASAASDTPSTNYISPKSKVITLLLCLFSGYLGGHRFYSGKTGTGLLWLFTLGLFGIGCIVDLVKIITDNFTDSDGLFIMV